MACKKISKRKLRTEIDIEDVRREVEIMRNLPSHPNIVKYKDVYEDKEAVYLVMELCQGGELFDRIVARKHYNERGAAATTKTILEVVKVCLFTFLPFLFLLIVRLIREKQKTYLSLSLKWSVSLERGIRKLVGYKKSFPENI